MPKPHAPRRGTLQFWPRVRARRETARVRRWAKLKEPKPAGFLGYKVGMCHVIVTDNRQKSLSKGEEIAYPATIIECPPLKIAAASFYKNGISGPKKVSTVFSQPLAKELSSIIQLPKKSVKTEYISDFDNVRIIVHTQPGRTGIGTKRPKLAELELGGSKEEKMAYIKQNLGKEIRAADVFSEGNLVDIHAVTKGKGFQGPVKRHGVMLRHHKSEKSRRANVRGSWTGVKMWTVPHSGQMGFQQRVDYNKWVLKIGDNVEEINRDGGFQNYGVVKNSYILIKGSVAGSKKRVIKLTRAVRPDRNVPKEAPLIKRIIK